MKRLSLEQFRRARHFLRTEARAVDRARFEHRFEGAPIERVTQTPEGTWEPTWTWGGFYPEAWEQAKTEWRGHLTLETLASLEAFGRLET